MIGSLVARARGAVSAHGLWGTAQRGAQTAWRRVFRHRTVILRYAGAETAGAQAREGVEIRRYDATTPVSESVMRDVGMLDGSEGVSYVRDQMQRGGALYVAVMDGRVVSMLWSKPGSRIPRWYVPLKGEDRALYSMLTAVGHRGRGLIGMLIAESVKDARAAGGEVYTDVRVWNKASLRAIERAGFARIAVVRPVRPGSWGAGVGAEPRVA